METLTKRQKETLAAIRTLTKTGRRPPTIRELGAKLGIHSTNGVEQHLVALETKGYITRVKKSSRSILVV